MDYFAGIDLGGTFIKGGLFDLDGTLLVKDSIPTDTSGGYERVVADIASLVKTMMRTINIDSVAGVGIGSPGIIDCQKGIVKLASNLGFQNAPLCQALSQQINVPVYIANDANIAALGESYGGDRKSLSSLVLITLGTGVGGGFVFDGQIYEGYQSAGGEFGHQVIRMDGKRCGCGKRGCYEAYASATALTDAAKKAAEQHPESLLSTLVEGKLDKINGKIVFEAVGKKDKIAKQVVSRYIRYVAEGIANVVNILRPEAILIGGGISVEKELLIKPLQQEVEKRLVISTEYAPLIVEAASLGNDAGIFGAARLVMLKHKQTNKTNK